MSFSFRVFLAFFGLQLCVVYFISQVLMDEFRPVVDQSTEDAMVDIANLLAELVSHEFSENNDAELSIAEAVKRFEQRRFNAVIYDVEKQNSAFRIYITDAKGIVIYDSAGIGVGQDYSQWNDVYLTLRGQYGARSTQTDPDDKYSSVMHIAAPIIRQQKIVGVLTVAKPSIKLQPFIDVARNAVQSRGVIIVLAALAFAMLISLILSRSVGRLVEYANAIADGKKAQKPQLSERELVRLADSIDNMRIQLDGKEYIENYVHSLTHELKSPVSAIRGAAELIDSKMPPEVLTRFSSNILNESERINDLISRLLALVMVESMSQLAAAQTLNLAQLIDKVITSKQHHILHKSLQVKVQCAHDLSITGDELLLSQSVDNLIQNAIEFTPDAGEIQVEVTNNDKITIAIADNGTGIPEYAKSKVFQRFYSLPRPDNDKRSSGLGLCFVKQVAQLHQGDIVLRDNDNGGLIAELILPV